MGLGKTVQAIAAMNQIDKRQPMRALIVCPASVKYNWAREIVEWFHRPVTPYVAASKRHDGIEKANLVVINYDIIWRKGILKKLMQNPFDVLVLDEAHYLKEATAKRTRAVFGANGLVTAAERVWALTGTPVQNRPVELWPLLYTLARDTIRPYESLQDFAEHFCAARLTPFGWDYKGASNIDELNERLRGFMLRRLKEEVLDQLPDRIEQTVPVTLVNHPEVSPTESVSELRRLVGEAKVPFASIYIRDTVENVGKVVVFAHHRNVISQLAKNLFDLNPVVFWGGMTAEIKQQKLDRFVNDPSCHVFIGQMSAAGTGIDGLQKVSSSVIFAEVDWSPGVMEQAVDRLRRIGQRNAVHVQYLVAEGTIDVTMRDMVARKRRVIGAILAQERTQPMALEQQLDAILKELQTLNKQMASVSLTAPAAKALPAPATAVLDAAEVDEPAEEKKPAKRGPKTKKAEATPDDDEMVDDTTPAPSAAAPKLTEDDLNMFRSRLNTYNEKDGKEGVSARRAEIINKVFKPVGIKSINELLTLDARVVKKFEQLLDALEAADGDEYYEESF